MPASSEPRSATAFSGILRPLSHLRFQEWVAAGVFLELWRVGLERYDELKGLDWSWLSMDGAMTKSPLGGGKNRPQPH